MPGELFPTSGPVSHEDVVDREDFIDQLVRRLLDRHSAMLAGPRRQGKSSVAYEVLRRLREEEACYTAAVDLSTVSSVRDFAEHLTAAALVNVAPAVRTALNIWHGIGRLLRMPEVRAKMAELDLSFGLRPGEEPRTEVLLEEALSLPERMATRDGRRFVVLFDEFQLAEAIGGPTLVAKMRGVFQVQRQTSFLFLGSQAGTMAQLFGASNQPFFRFANKLDLPPVPDEAWRAYILRRFTEHHIEVEEGAVDVILEHSGGHPYDTMKIAYEAYLKAERTRRVDARTAAAACMEAQFGLRDIFEAEMDSLGSRARVLLRRLALKEPLYAGERSGAAIERALLLLVRRGLVRKLPGRGRYEFVEPMLAQHLSRRRE